MRKWLYNENGGKIFDGDEAIENALKDGYVDSPAKVGNDNTNDSNDATNNASNDVDVDVDADADADVKDISVMTVDEMKENFTVKELKQYCKDNNITGMSNKNEQIVAEALFDHFNNEEEL